MASAFIKPVKFGKFMLGSPGTGRFGIQQQQRMTLRTARPQLFGDEVANPSSVPQPKANRIKGSYHWMNERAVSIISVPILATAFIYGAHPINDMLMGIVLPLHVHMGFQQVLLDYFEQRRWPVLGRVFKYSLAVVTGLAMFGAWRINTTDVGLTSYFSRMWNANKNKKNSDNQ
ncbi:membrane anchor subunit of succinate dehydrogenase, Sdh4 [Coemansia sp. RSA 1365]|nr:membrane anchor subunit of succinate dehydrogenase, Sdh4 [Coemansia sp. RSA 1365]